MHQAVWEIFHSQQKPEFEFLSSFRNHLPGSERVQAAQVQSWMSLKSRLSLLTDGPMSKVIFEMMLKEEKKEL